jgi:hypothetical protein
VGKVLARLRIMSRYFPGGKVLMFGYQQSYEMSISDELKNRFRCEVNLLEQEGFSFCGMHHETIWPFSVIIFFPVYLMMVFKEYVRIEPPLRISSYHLMYLLKDSATFAYIYGLGCKFYTKFTDGTWLVSNTMQSLRDKNVVVLKRDPESEMPTEKVWQLHQMKIQECQAKGMQLAARVTFSDWVEIESRFDRGNVMSLVIQGIIWLIILVWLVMKCISFLNTLL